MDYPPQFTPQSRARVEAERVKAGRDFARALREEPPAGWAKGKHVWDQCAFYSYVLRVFRAFTREACELGKKGTWAIDRIRVEVDEFLASFTFDAYYEKGSDRFGQKLRGVIVNWDGGLEPTWERELKKSEEYREFEDDLLAVAELQGEQATPKKQRTLSGGKTRRIAADLESGVRERAAKRGAVVMPILTNKRWTQGRLATEAGISKNSVYGYLDGTRRRITRGNHKAIADALGLQPGQLAD
jgi:hypothetical protein